MPNTTMELPTMQPDGDVYTSNGDILENSLTFENESGGGVMQHNEDKKLKIEESTETSTEDLPGTVDDICSINFSELPDSSLKPLKSENTMDVDTNIGEETNEERSSQAVPSQSSVSTSPDTPKTNEKKPRARELDLSSTPTANKIAKMSPRATRSSQNPDFAAKQRKFLNRVHDPIRRDNSDSETSQGFSTPVSSKAVKDSKPRSTERKSLSDLKRKPEKDATPKRSAETDDEGSAKKRRNKEPTKVVGGVDSYCWRCHRDGNVIPCEICPRVYHLKCVQMEAAPSKGWMCPECSTVTEAENTDTRSRAMRMLTLDQFCNLLRFALNRMKSHEGAEDFAKPVDVAAFPNYRDFIVKPMDLSQLERNIKAKMYGSTEAFHADAKWIVHNSIIFNSVQSKFTNTARALLKIVRQEMQEIENCPDCYQNAHTRSSDSWFIEACRRPHVLVWAKLKGFPFWPAKAMSTNSENLVDVRFFGAHDRAWVPVSSCFLYSKLSPAPGSKNKRNLEDCLQELECHIKKLRDKFGQFEYPPYKTLYDPKKEEAQLAMFLPKYDMKLAGKRTVRLSLHHDGARRSSPAIAEKSASQNTSVTQSIPRLAAAKTTPPSKQLPVLMENKQASIEMDPTQMTSLKPPPMVIFPGESKASKQPLMSGPPINAVSKAKPQKQGEQPNSTSDKPTPDKHGPSPSGKKTYKTPLTAAAKKCFASEEKSCYKCNTKTASEWSVDESGKSVCSSCIVSPSKSLPTDSPQKDKVCAQCQSQTSATWHRAGNGDLQCVACTSPHIIQLEKPQIEFEKDEQAGASNSTMRGIVTVQRKLADTQTADMRGIVTVQRKLADTQTADDSETRDIETAAGKKLAETVTEESLSVVESGGGDEPVSIEEGGEPHTPSASGDAPVMDFATVDSPPKFVIPKTRESDSPETLKKVSIVDRLKEKLCFVIEEAIGLKDDGTVGENEEEEVEKGNEEETKTASKKTSGAIEITKDTIAQVVLHDIRNNKLMMDKIRESEAKQMKKNNVMEMEARSPSDSSSDHDTDPSSSVESDSFVTDEDNGKKKKQNNINNVVKTLKERKSSVDEKNDQNNKSAKIKGSNTVLLDDSNDEVPVLIIDEGEYNSSDSKKSPGKSDKSRRKGIPAKVYSRSSTSTDSSEISSPDEQSGNPKKVTEVLDEVSGKFRRSSGDSNVTITLVTDEASPQKTPPKQIRSVNISKSLSLSVINKSSAGLEMECAESDIDDKIIVDSVIKKLPAKPTARKTLPNPPRSISVPGPQEKSLATQAKSSEGEVRLRPQQNLVNPSIPPPLINLRPLSKVNIGAGKLQNGTVAAGQKPSPTRAAVTPAPTTDVGSANAQLEDAVNKMSGHLRSVVEEVLRGMSESGASEATIKAMQVEMERLQWRHRQEIAELKHNTDLLAMEIRATMEAEKQRALLDAKHKHEIEKEQAIQETKRKQWCAFCQKEAQLYCCWNTSYCSYNCQQSHWMPHMNSCLNKQQGTPAEVPRAPPPRPPPYNLPAGQRPRQQLMPPPANPPPYPSQYRPNQVYTAGPRFSHALRPTNPNPLMFPLDQHFAPM